MDNANKGPWSSRLEVCRKLVTLPFTHWLTFKPQRTE